MLFAFSKNRRIVVSSDFNKLRTNSKKKRHGPLVAYYRFREEGFSRFAISVSSKTFNSVQRNKIKRISREIFRTRATEKCPVDILFVVIEKGEINDFAGLVEKLKEAAIFLTSEITKLNR